MKKWLIFVLICFIPLYLYAEKVKITDPPATTSTGWTDDGTVIRLTTITDNVGIGTTEPTAKLQVIGNILANTIGTTTLNITGDASFVNIIAGTWSGDTLVIEKIPTIPLETKVSGTLPAANMTIVNLAGSMVSGTLPLANTSIIPLTTQVSGTLPAANMTIVDLSGNMVSGTLPLANILTIPLATKTSGTLPDASSPLNIINTSITSGTGTFTNLTVVSNTVDFADVTDGYVLTFDTGTNTWAGSGAGTGDITSVGDALTGAIFAAGDSDSLFGNLIGIGATAPTAFLNVKPTTATPIFILKLADTSANDRLVVQSDGKVGIGKTNPGQALDVVGTIEGDVLTEATNAIPNATDKLDFFAATTSAELAGVISDEQGSGSLVFATSPTLVTPTLGAATATTLDTGQGANELYDMNQNVQTTDNVIFKTLKTSDTIPLMALAIYNPAPSMDGIGKVLSTIKNYVIDKANAIITSGTNVIFTLKVVDTDGTTSLGNLTAGQTATTSILNITSFTGGTVPAGKLLIMDTVSNSTTDTLTMFRLEVHGHEN